jgi:hypothetical protein
VQSLAAVQASSIAGSADVDGDAVATAGALADVAVVGSLVVLAGVGVHATTHIAAIKRTIVFIVRA